MKTRKELVDYFTLRYQKNGFFSDPEIEQMLAEKATEELQVTYNYNLKVSREKQSILENGLTTYELIFNMYKQAKICKNKLLTFLHSIEAYSYEDNEIKFFHSKRGADSIRRIPKKFIQKIENEFPDLKTKKDSTIIGKNDISSFNVGDKVLLQFNNWYGGSTEKGTVHAINDNEIIIRKYRSRSTGWTFAAGDECNIEKINSFQEVI